MSSKPALDEEQQAELNRTKVAQQLKDEKYIRAHPEVDDMLALFVESALEKRPEDVLTFAGDFFTNDELKAKVEARIKDQTAK